MPIVYLWSNTPQGLTVTDTKAPLVIDLQNFKCEAQVESIDQKESVVEEIEEKVIEEETEEEVVEKELVPEEIIEEKVVEEEPIKELTEELVPDPLPPKPEVTTEKPKPIAEKKKQVKKKVKKKKSVKKQKKSKSQKVKSKSGGRASAQKKNKFLATLKRKISQNKSYPRVAKKRGMQGSVKVHFTITASGSVCNISVQGPKIFVNATKKAVQRAFPVKPIGVSLPLTVTFSLNYILKD
jgi:protein TonB